MAPPNKSNYSNLACDDILIFYHQFLKRKIDGHGPPYHMLFARFQIRAFLYILETFVETNLIIS